MKLTDIERDAVSALTACLAEIPFVRVGECKTNRASDGLGLVAGITLPDQEQTLVIELRSNGQPRLARQAINQLLRSLPAEAGAYGVFMAPYISPRAADICEREGVGFVDFAGNCRLCFGRVYLRKTGFKNPLARERQLRTLYSPKAARVLRVLLADPQRRWRVQHLAREAAVSLGQVSGVKKLLADREWTRSDAQGLWLIDPEALLLEWARNPRYRRDEQLDCYTLQGGAEIEARLAEACSRRGCPYALTGFSAGARWAPMVRNPRVSAYVAGEVDAIMHDLQLKPVNTGANVTLIRPGDTGVFYGAQTFDDVTVVSLPQAYVDLSGLGGRGAEAAEALLQVLRNQW